MINVRRVMGAETEFGVWQPANPTANPMRDSARVVDAYAAPNGLVSSQNFWDYSAENPLADARGFLMSVDDAHISQLTHIPQDAPDAQYLANVVTHNGARLYVDHAHPEYSSPETLTPRDALLYDRAGDAVALEAVRALAKTDEPVNLYKNNTDSKGASYGSHENYLVDRSTTFDDIVEGLTPFFVTRPILCGSGRVGIGQTGGVPGYQISSRADFFEERVGLETTLRRPIINTRDEPHADPRLYRRLHVIVGDATLAEPATLVRFGATSLVLALIEAGLAPRIELADPVEAMHTVSHDLGLSTPLPLEGGGTLTALNIQQMYFDAVKTHADMSHPETAEVVATWQRFLTGLAEDPMGLADSIDWVAKYRLLRTYVERENLPWDHPKLALIDVQYHDVRPEKGLFYKLESAGRIRRFTTDKQVMHAKEYPPEDTRAWLRGTLVSRFAPFVVAANWDTVMLTVGGSVVQLPLKYPLAATRTDAEEILAPVSTGKDLLEALSLITLTDNNGKA